MGILSNKYDSELDIDVLIASAKYRYRFHENCTLIFDNKWSAEAQLTQQLSGDLTQRINARIMEILNLR